jgi:hypothetical protein
VQLPPGTNTVGFPAFAGQLIDIAFDQHGSSKNNLQDPPQVRKMVPKGGSQTAQLFTISLVLHSIIYNYIQISTSQAKKIDASGKMMRLYQGNPTVTQVGKRFFPVSELQ